MRILGFEFRREAKAAQFEDVLRRLIAAREGRWPTENVTPDNCEESPTVKAIVTAVSNRLSVTPVHVYRKATKNGRETKEQLPDHPVAKLLAYPNSYQTRTNFWGDAASCLVRHGNFYAYKGRGTTGPIRFLDPLKASAVSIEQNEGGSLVYRYGERVPKDYTASQILHVRGSARDFVMGDSPVRDVSTTIALEIAAERFGLSFFANGALPLMVFKYAQGTGGFKSKEQEEQFIRDFQQALGGNNRHRAMLLPKGLEAGDPVRVENDKAQMIETRRYQRTVIAGAFGVPPQYVGDLERATFNNAEQQTIQFTADVIYPVVQKFEAALERDLLTDEDWRSGVVIRFNLDSILRADFKSRQEGLQIQRQNGVLSANEWREIEGKNPVADGKGGDDYLYPANMMIAGQPPPEPEMPDRGSPDEPEPPKQQIFNLSLPTHVHTNVGGANVDVRGSTTSVESAAPEVKIDNHVETPAVNIEPTQVNVTSPEINVTAPPPEIKVLASVAAPTVNVEAPEVKITNQVDVPSVNVEAPIVNLEAKMPKPSVEIQTITVKSPDVTVVNELPDYEQVESEAVRDDKGRLTKTVTTKRRRK